MLFLGSIPIPGQDAKLKERISGCDQVRSRKRPSLGSLKVLRGMDLCQKGSVLRPPHHRQANAAG